MEYGFFGLIVLVADVYALYNIITSGISTLAKVVWCLVVLIMPILGFVAWLLAGPRGSNART